MGNLYIQKIKSGQTKGMFNVIHHDLDKNFRVAQFLSRKEAELFVKSYENENHPRD